MSAATHEIASAFVDARRAGTAMADYPGKPPSDLAAAYAIQDCALALWNRDVGGWKVGKINPPASTELGTNRLAGPVFSDLIQQEEAGGNAFPIFDHGFAAVEAEFMLRLNPQAGTLPQDNAEAMQWVDAIRIGIEVASSPYPGINADGPCVTISDHGNNAGLLLGRSVARELWTNLDDIEVSLDIDGETAGRATTASMLDGPFGAVRFLLDNLERRGIAVQPGWWVSSGAITGVHQVSRGARVTARFGTVGEVSLFID